MTRLRIVHFFFSVLILHLYIICKTARRHRRITRPVPTHGRRKCPVASGFEISNCTRERDIQHFRLLPATVVTSVVPRARLLLGATYRRSSTQSHLWKNLRGFWNRETFNRRKSRTCAGK